MPTHPRPMACCCVRMAQGRMHLHATCQHRLGCMCQSLHHLLRPHLAEVSPSKALNSSTAAVYC
jgi:hypothetical protein